MTTDVHTNTLRGIDRLNAGHTTKTATVDQPRELEYAYPARPETVGRIRDTVTRAAHEWGAPIDTCTRIRLVINELATNALAASNPEESIRVRLHVEPLTIRIGVWDANPDTPKTKDGKLSPEETETLPDALPKDHDFDAWSLLLVRELTSGHHVEKTEPGGKYIWVDFDLPDGHILS